MAKTSIHSWPVYSGPSYASAKIFNSGSGNLQNLIVLSYSVHVGLGIVLISQIMLYTMNNLIFNLKLFLKLVGYIFLDQISHSNIRIIKKHFPYY